MKHFADADTCDEFAFIGMDEAGYGPNLGPLVLTATRWSTPDAGVETDFYASLNAAVHQKSHLKQTRLHIADSKEVNTGKHGFVSLETSALAILQNLNVPCQTFQQLWEGLCSQPYPHENPWFQDADLKLPVVANANTLSQLSRQLASACKDSGISPTSVRSQIITARHFNSLIEQDGSKGIMLSRLAFRLLREVWNPEETASVLFIGDKHGGRNRYDELLSEVLEGNMVYRLEEGRSQSCYRVRNAELRFQTKGEQHFPVAVASIVSKYVRELSMNLFNRYWQQHCPNVKQTLGYPQDAVRFRSEVDSIRTQLGIPDEIFWRCR